MVWGVVLRRMEGGRERGDEDDGSLCFWLILTVIVELSMIESPLEIEGDIKECPVVVTTISN